PTFSTLRDIHRACGLLPVARGRERNPTATLAEHMLLMQGFMGTSTVSFPHHWRLQHHDSTWPNLVDTLKSRCRGKDQIDIVAELGLILFDDHDIIASLLHNGLGHMPLSQ